MKRVLESGSKGFLFRGGLKLTRLEGLVVSAVVSCLGVLRSKGMNTGG